MSTDKTKHYENHQLLEVNLDSGKQWHIFENIAVDTEDSSNSKGNSLCNEHSFNNDLLVNDPIHVTSIMKLYGKLKDLGEIEFCDKCHVQISKIFTLKTIYKGFELFKNKMNDLAIRTAILNTIPNPKAKHYFINVIEMLRKKGVIIEPEPEILSIHDDFYDESMFTNCLRDE